MTDVLIHRGSVKDIYRVREKSDELIFRYSNRYSIFDWGEMPDHIPKKGEALALMGIKLLEHLETKGIKTHFLGRGPGPADMRVREVAIPRGESDSQAVQSLVPLEVIYRFGVPKGSSLLRKNPSYYEGQLFSEIKIDVTTKLERIDRSLTADGAMELASLSKAEWEDLLQFTRTIALAIDQVFARAGFKLWDGKFEFAFIEGELPGRRSFMLVDTIGLDEIRLTFNGEVVSKELLRQFYLKSPWYQAMEVAKQKDSQNFREYCEKELKQSPALLPTTVVSTLSEIYGLVAKMIGEENPAELQTFQTQLTQKISQLKGESSL